ncbi:MAG: CtpF protein [Hyphomicrobiales bacterium]|nr:CtpF protein [Hyphomicrobiales bacterium]
MSDAANPIAPVPRVSIQAFCEEASTHEILTQAAADRRMSRAHMRVHMGGVTGALAAYSEAPTPNLIVIESFVPRDELVAQLDRLAEICDEGTKVIAIGRVNDIVLYRELMARGVSEYLVHPFDSAAFTRIVSDLYAHPSQRLVGRVIAVTGAKGGVGASTVAHNLAWTMARTLEQPTILVDMDMPFGTAGLDFNQDPAQGVADAVFASDRLDLNFVERVLTRCTDNLSIMAAPAMLDRNYDIHEDAFEPVIELLRGAAPYIVLDLPHGWDGWKRNTLVSSDEVIVVAGPDLANLRNCKNLFDHMRAARPADLFPRFVMNGVGMPRRPEIPATDFAQALDLDPVAAIAHDPKLFGSATNNGLMIGEADPSARANAVFAELTRLVSGRVDTRAPRRGLLQPIVRKFRGAFA